MPVPLPRSRALWFVLAVAFALLAAVAPNAMAHGGGVAVHADQRPRRQHRAAVRPRSRRHAVARGHFATGGVGLATLGGRQGAVELSGDGRHLYAVNAGSDSVSVFRVGDRRTDLVGSFPRAAPRRRASPSTAAASTSSTPAGRRASPPSSAGSTARSSRSLAARASSRRAPRAPRRSRSRPTAARSWSANALPTGSRRCRSTASGAPARRSSPPRAARCRSASGSPGRATLVVSEAAPSTSRRTAPASSALRTISASLPVGQGAACWVAVSPDGRFAYTGNASGSISGFAIGRDGSCRR